MLIARPLWIAVAALALAGCNVNEKGQYTTRKLPDTAAATAPTQATQIAVMQGRPDRAFTPIGPLSVTVNKLTAFHPNPTVEDAMQELRSEAAKLGADAVIEAEISGVKIVPQSWGAREATGIAVKY